MFTLFETDSSFNEMTIVVQTYHNMIKRNKATVAKLYVDESDFPKAYRQNSAVPIDGDGPSSFVIELQFILDLLVQYYRHYDGTAPIHIICSERALPKIINKINDVMKYLLSDDGILDYNSMTIGELIDMFTYDMHIFDANSISYPTIKLFLHDFIAIFMLRKRRNVLTIKIYKPRANIVSPHGTRQAIALNNAKNLTYDPHELPEEIEESENLL